MALKVFSVKMDEEMVDALELLAKEQNSSRNALITEAVQAVLSGGMGKVLEKKVQGCLGNILGFNDQEGFNEAVEAKFGSMLVDLIDSRLKFLFSMDLTEELQEGSLAAMVAAQRPKPKENIDIKAALSSIAKSIDIAGEPISLDDLAAQLQVDKAMLSKALSDIGIKTERKRVGGGERRMYYMPSQAEAVKKALES